MNINWWSPPEKDFNKLKKIVKNFKFVKYVQWGKEGINLTVKLKDKKEFLNIPNQDNILNIVFDQLNKIQWSENM